MFPGSFPCAAHPGPAQHLLNLFILRLHQHGELQVLNGVLVSTEHLLRMNRAQFNPVSSHRNTAVGFEFLGHSGLCAIFCDARKIRREKESRAALNPFIVRVLTHCSDSVLHQLASEVMSAAVNPVRATSSVSLFPLTVSWGREPSTWVRLWYICSAVPSRNRPHPPMNSVSPEKGNQGQVEAVVSLRHATQQEQCTMCWSTRTHISSHSEWRYYVYIWCHVAWQWVCCTGMSCMKDCTLQPVHQLFMFTDKDLWTQRGRQCTHPPTQSSTCDQRYGREWTGTSHWWS